MYDNIAKLLAIDEVTYDEDRNEVITYTERTVYVQPRGVFASEFYSAAQLGLNLSITLELANQFDYEGEKIVEYGGKTYNVVRVDWTAQRDRLRLVCEERVGNG